MKIRVNATRYGCCHSDNEVNRIRNGPSNNLRLAESSPQFQWLLPIWDGQTCKYSILLLSLLFKRIYILFEISFTQLFIAHCMIYEHYLSRDLQSKWSGTRRTLKASFTRVAGRCLLSRVHAQECKVYPKIEVFVFYFLYSYAVFRPVYKQCIYHFVLLLSQFYSICL